MFFNFISSCSICTCKTDVIIMYAKMFQVGNSSHLVALVESVSCAFVPLFQNSPSSLQIVSDSFLQINMRIPAVRTLSQNHLLDMNLLDRIISFFQFEWTWKLQCLHLEDHLAFRSMRMLASYRCSMRCEWNMGPFFRNEYIIFDCYLMLA